MNIYVCVKQVPDTETKMELKDAKTIDQATIKKWIVNPYDEYAVEEAVQLRQHGRRAIRLRDNAVQEVRPGQVELVFRDALGLVGRKRPKTRSAHRWRWGRIGRCISSVMSFWTIT